MTTETAARALAREGSGPNTWSLVLAVAGGVLAAVAAVAAAITPPTWYILTPGSSAVPPWLSFVSRPALVASVLASVAGLTTGIIALARRRGGWQAILAVVIVVAVNPLAVVLYFTLGLALYD